LKVDFARLNHVLIPATKSERDRYRGGRVMRRAGGLVWLASRTTREGRVLLAATFAAAAFAVDVIRTQSHELVIACASLLVTSLLFTRAYRLDGVQAAVSAPRRVTLGDELTFTLSLRNDGTSEHRCIRFERPLLPWDGTWTYAPPTLGKLGPGERAAARARARFVERGEHHIDRFRVAALLPLGLSQGRPLRTDGVRFVVVPKVANVTAITLGNDQGGHTGESARGSRNGDASDLRGVRKYRPGDSVRKLHARSWARHREPMVREYNQEERARIGVVVDDDEGAGTAAHFEAALSLAAGVVARAGQGELPVEWLVVGRAAHQLTANRHPASLDEALDFLASVRQSEGFATEHLVGHGGSLLDGMSSVVLVLLAWDAARSRFVADLRARGVNCVVLIVGDAAAEVPRAVTITREAIVTGKEIAL
jgi:uncharacterized protein (DUF58 family)